MKNAHIRKNLKENRKYYIFLMKFNVENVKCVDYKMYNQSLKTMSH